MLEDIEKKPSYVNKILESKEPRAPGSLCERVNQPFQISNRFYYAILGFIGISLAVALLATLQSTFLSSIATVDTMMLFKKLVKCVFSTVITVYGFILVSGELCDWSPSFGKYRVFYLLISLFVMVISLIVMLGMSTPDLAKLKLQFSYGVCIDAGLLLYLAHSLRSNP